jgi:hypothetical protein
MLFTLTKVVFDLLEIAFDVKVFAQGDTSAYL